MKTSPTPQYEIEQRIHVLVPMRDGVRLSTDLYLPKGDGPWPVILTRTPYGNSDPLRVERLAYFAARGFACAHQDCRGRHDSEGEWEPIRHERNDGIDTIDWLSKQDFCNGSVGMLGRSYEGYCTWMAAHDRHPALKAIVPIVALPDPVLNLPYQNGAFFWNLIVWALMVHGRTNQNLSLVNWTKLFTHAPMRDMDKAVGMESKTWQNWMDHPTLDDWWKKACYMHLRSRVDIPAMHICGWYDDDGIATYLNYPGMRKDAATQKARDEQRLIIGPWPHKINASTKVGEIDFGPSAVVDLNAIIFRFFAKHLTGEDHCTEPEPRCRLFIMGENRWHGFDDWPIKGAVRTKLYLTSGGNANSLFGDGALSDSPPGADIPPDKYIYDPDNPVPYVTNPVDLQLGEATEQQAIERRPDVLVYTTPPLEKDVAVCGRVFVELHISTDVRGTDFTAKLVDVWENGRAIQVCDGIQRAEFRNTLEKAEWLEKDKVYRLTIDAWATGIRFFKGHCIRLEISSSAVPKFCRHLNTDTDQASETRGIVAHHVVHHDAKYPSHLTLDIIPEEMLKDNVIQP
jgi:hypothetical protein